MRPSAASHPVLEQPPERAHIVHVYQKDDLLAEIVGLFAAAGIAREEGVVIIATPEHQALFARTLDKMGFDLDQARREGRFASLDAATVLASFSANGRFDSDIFQRVIGEALDGVGPKGRPVRAYGEMVDILWQKGDREAAIALERMWNDLGKRRSFALFCAYRVDNLDAKAYESGLQAICDTHSHFIPALDYRQFEASVDAAIAQTLGPALAKMLWQVSGPQNHPAAEMPEAQSRLLWLKKNMPITGDKVLDRLKAYRRGEPK